MPNILTEIANRISSLERRLAQLETIEIGAGVTGWTEITSGSLAAAASEFQITNIPQTYNHLLLLTRLRSTGSPAPGTYIQVNGQTGASYVTIQGTSGAAGPTNFWWGPFQEPSNSASQVYNIGLIFFPNYSSTTKKAMMNFSGRIANGTTTYGHAIWQFGQWFGASAITSIKVFDGAQNLAASSWYTLYGIA